MINLSGKVNLFSYPCGESSVCYPISGFLQPGTYIFEVYGAQGGTINPNYGKGGYSYGILSIEKRTRIFLYIGSKGHCVNTLSTETNSSFNGGGKGKLSSGGNLACSGGGGTDIRIAVDDLYHRVIVAGGGGGSSFYGSERIGGVGGGITGSDATLASQGTNGGGGKQDGGGKSDLEYPQAQGYFGGGGSASSWDGGGGGGGWFGGGAGLKYVQAGGGGSGFFYTDNTKGVAISLGLELEEKYILSGGITHDGNQKFPGINNEWEVGHEGDGAIRITIVNMNRKHTCTSFMSTFYYVQFIFFIYS